jgi:two-component system, OmpR family, sensor kinase
MRLRARLTAFYSATVGLVLTLVFGAILYVQPRVRLSLIDDDLKGHVQTLDGVLRFDVDKLHDLGRATREMLTEVSLPGLGIAIYTPQGELVGARWDGLDPLEPPYPVAPGTATLRTVLTHAGPARLIHRPVGARAEAVAVLVSPLDGVGKQVAILRGTLLVVVPLAVFAAAVGGWILLARVFRPVEIMAAEVEQITPADSARRLSVTGVPAELAGLARGFNDLLDRLSSALERQREFMADASHELRTPAHVARTAAEVTLSSEARTSTEYREALAIVAEQTRRMSRLIGDMLLLARADMGRRPLEPVSFYLDELLDETVRGLRVLTPESISIAFECPEDIQMYGDETLIRQLITNLVENAVRHSPEGATVRVFVRTGDDGIVLDVIDQGSGISMQDRSRIFDRFVKLDATREQRSGAGLGLPLSRWIAEAHGGTLIVADSGLHGSTFRATLPLTVSRRAVAQFPQSA